MAAKPELGVGGMKTTAIGTENVGDCCVSGRVINGMDLQMKEAVCRRDDCTKVCGMDGVKTRMVAMGGGEVGGEFEEGVEDENGGEDGTGGKVGAEVREMGEG